MEKEYYAFVSYKSEDIDWAIWFQHELEHYHLPASLNGRSDLPKELRPVFRDLDELSAGNLPDQIRRALANSANLVVICSPMSAKSPWVNREVEMFISLGKTDKIFPFIIEGDSPQDFFPPALLNLPKKEERLGGDVNKNGKDAAFVKVVAGMLGVGFDTLWERYEKEKAEEERKRREQRDNLLRSQSLFLAEKSISLLEEGDPYKACLYALEALPRSMKCPERPILQEAVDSLYKSVIFEYGILHEGNKYNFLKSAVLRLRFNSNGNYLISCSQNNIQVRNAQTSMFVENIQDHTDSANDDKFTDCVCLGIGQKERIIYSLDDGTLISKNLHSHSSQQLFKYQGTWVNTMATNGDVIVVALVDWTIDIYNAEGKRLSKGIKKTHNGTITSIDCNSKYIVTGSFDKTIAVWNIETFELVEFLKPKLKTSKDYISVVKLGSDYLVAGTTDGTIYLWKIDSWKKMRIISDSKENHGTVHTLFLYENIIFAGYHDGMIILWDNRGSIINEIRVGEESINSISFNGKCLVAGTEDGNVYTFVVKFAKLLDVTSKKGTTKDLLWLNGQEEDAMSYIPHCPLFDVQRKNRNKEITESER